MITGTRINLLFQKLLINNYRIQKEKPESKALHHLVAAIDSKLSQQQMNKLKLGLTYFQSKSELEKNMLKILCAPSHNIPLEENVRRKISFFITNTHIGNSDCPGT